MTAVFIGSNNAFAVEGGPASGTGSSSSGSGVGSDLFEMNAAEFEAARHIYRMADERRRSKKLNNNNKN